MTTMEERFRAIEEDLLPPEYHAAKKLVVEAERMIAAPPAFPTAADQLDPFALGEIHEEWVDALIDQKDTQDRLQRRRAILLDLRNAAESRATTAASSINTQVLAAYHDELMKLLDEAEELAGQLGGVDSAEAAIALDRGPVWKRLSQLADDYADLRRAQRARTSTDLIRRAQPAQGGEEHASDLYIANLDEIWPEWRTGGAANGVSINHVGGAEHRYEPWPREPVQLLLWLATGPAEAWVPTAAELHRHWADRQKRANPMPAPGPAEPKRRGPVRRADPFQRSAKAVKAVDNVAVTTGGFQ